MDEGSLAEISGIVALFFSVRKGFEKSIGLLTFLPSFSFKANE